MQITVGIERGHPADPAAAQDDRHYVWYIVDGSGYESACFLDPGFTAPNDAARMAVSVGRAFADAGHEVLYEPDDGALDALLTKN